MTFTLTNGFESGTNGTTITTANSSYSAIGGTAMGNAFDVTDSTSDTLVFDNTHAAHGTYSCKLATGATAENVYVGWTTSISMTGSQIWYRLYLYFTANPGTAFRILLINSSGGTNIAVVVNTGGTLRVNNSAGSQISVTTASIPLNQWFRVEGYCICSATVGQSQLILYDTADSTTPTETDTTAATQNTGAGPVTGAYFGETGTTIADLGPYWQDDVGVTDQGYLGPSQYTGSPSAAVTLTATATGGRPGGSSASAAVFVALKQA